jgi:BirA family biotin operon repressor/biotin-[acetyl-CoA-carboxylase] ligase
VDALTPDALRPLLRGSFGSLYLYDPVSVSTQDVLRDSRYPEGAVAVAEHQTGGRGRSGKTWSDTTGTSILMSVLLRPPGGARPAPEISLVAAVSVAEAIDQATGLTAGVKWPNDVLLNGHKVAGILLEATDGNVVCGIGINVNQSGGELPTGSRVPASSLRLEAGHVIERAPLLADILARLEDLYAAWVTSGLAPVLDQLAQRDVLRGRTVRVGRTRGTADGLAPDGRLAIVSEGRRTLVESGEVVFEA